MSKRDFGDIKCLLHFDYPYFNEPHDGLGDETGISTFDNVGNFKLAGNRIPYAISGSPKFGYRCACFPDAESYIEAACNDDDNILALNSDNDYEFECFIYTGGAYNENNQAPNHILRLQYYDGTLDDDVELFRWSFGLSCSTVDLTENEDSPARYSETYSLNFYLVSESFGLNESFSHSFDTIFYDEGDDEAFQNALDECYRIPFMDWTHVLLRLSGNKAYIFINGLLFFQANLNPHISLPTETVRIGGFMDTGYMDEFVFRHSAGNGNPAVPREPYRASLDVDSVGGYGSGVDGDVIVSANVQINSYGLIVSISDNRTFAVKSWSNCNSAYSAGIPAVGSEVMIHITAPKSTNSADYPLVGLYEFAHISTIDGLNVTLDHDIINEFTLDSSLLDTYYVQVITVPNYNSLTVNAGKTVSPLSWSISKGGGIVAFRCKGNCTINGSIITMGKGATRYDLHQMTHSKLIDRFLCAKGGGIFITCGGTFSCSDDARLGATWSGDGDENGNGAAGFGGNGGNITYSGKTAKGGKGGVGGGGGGATWASPSNYRNGGDVGSDGNATYNISGSGGGGCGGNGGTSYISYIGGAGGGGQAGSQGLSGKTTDSSSYASSPSKASINGGQGGNRNGSSAFSGPGGGGPGGNGGNGYSAQYFFQAGYAGACIILISNVLNASNQNISTGGKAGQGNDTNATQSSASGGGTGFCYIAARRQV